jgi:hypothetical protein
MTHFPATSAALAILALGAAGGCAPAHTRQAAAPKPAPAAALAPPPAPARMMKMICRNSQDGRPVACGTPGAVMVGMKPR